MRPKDIKTACILMVALGAGACSEVGFKNNAVTVPTLYVTTPAGNADADADVSSVNALTMNPGGDHHISLAEAVLAINNDSAMNPGNFYSVEFAMDPFAFPLQPTIFLAKTVVLTASYTTIKGPDPINGALQIQIEPPPELLPLSAVDSILIEGNHNKLLLLAIRNVTIGEDPAKNANNGLPDYTRLSPSGNLIQGNYFCTDLSGKGPPQMALGDLGESAAVAIGDGATSNLIRGNLIGGCSGQFLKSSYGGIIIANQAAHNAVEGNRIGFGLDWRTLKIATGIGIQDNAQFNCIGDDTCLGPEYQFDPGDPTSVPWGHKQAPGCGKALGDGNPCNYIGNSAADGIDIQNTAGSNSITGNFIGVGQDGVTATPNAGAGIALYGGVATRIGGSKTPTDPNAQALLEGWECAGDCNVISGNGGAGVMVSGLSAQGNSIKGNLIGATADGALPLPNDTATGATAQVIVADGASRTDIGGEKVGTDCTGACNVIVGAALQGAEVRVSGLFTADNRVLGNWIGVSEQKGRKPTLFSNKGLGVSVDDGATRTVIGAPRASKSITCDGGCNLVGEHMGHGIQVIGGISATDSTVIQGNFLGVTPRADGALPNGQDRFDSAILLYAIGPTIVSTIIGGISTGHPGEQCDGACNLISGNGFHGIHLFGTQVFNTTVQGNFIGADPMGLKSIAGNAGAGIVASMGVPGATIGIGVEAEVNPGLGCTGACNVIAGNGGAGVQVEDNSVGISIRGNDIRENGNIGINLSADDRPKGDLVTPNHFPTVITGPNRLQNFPVGVTYAALGSVVAIGGLLDTDQDPTRTTIDLYASATRDGSGFGQGEYYLGSVTPGEDGTFYLKIPAPLPRHFVSATATDALGNTSEFSPVCRDDIDGDGLCDDWEDSGIDFDGNGDPDFDLPGQGAIVGTRDVFVEVDYMSCLVSGCAKGDLHTHEPDPQNVFGAIPADPRGKGLGGVVFSFANIPPTIPPLPPPETQSPQFPIALHVIKDEALPEIQNVYIAKPVNGATSFWDIKGGPLVSLRNECGTGPDDAHFGTVLERGANCHNRIGGKRLSFRYMVFGHTLADYPGASGVGSGPNALVTLGDLSPADWTHYGGRAVMEGGTFMHELGHTLGLCHGGPLPATLKWCSEMSGDHSVQWKPNYLSVMNYAFQGGDFVPDRPLDYSEFALDELNEDSLVVADGISRAAFPGSGRWSATAFACKDPKAPNCRMTPSNDPAAGGLAGVVGPIDWNCGVPAPVPTSMGIHDNPGDSHIGLDACLLDAKIRLGGADDWRNLVLGPLLLYSPSQHGEGIEYETFPLQQVFQSGGRSAGVWK